MKEWFDKYRKYVEQGIFLLIMVVLILAVYTIFKNVGELTHVAVSKAGIFLDVISPIIYAAALAYILYRPMMYLEKKLKDLKNKLFKNKAKDQAHRESTTKGTDLGIRLLSIVSVFLVVGGAIMLLIHFLVPPIIENIQKVLTSNVQLGESIKVAL